MSHDEALVERLRRKLLQQWAEHDNHFGTEDVMVATLDLLAAEGRLIEPPPFYLALDADDEWAIWRDVPDGQPECLGFRFMTGNARIDRPVAEWLWSVIPSREVTE